jgi:hypothetical protein
MLCDGAPGGLSLIDQERVNTVVSNRIGSVAAHHLSCPADCPDRKAQGR